MLAGLGDCRVATAARSKPVARWMKRRLKQRLEHLPHGLHHHPVCHVGDPQPALPAARLGDQRPASLARTPRPVQQGRAQPTGDVRPLRLQRLDRHPVRASGPLIRHHLQQRRAESLDNSLHRRGHPSLLVDDRLRHSGNRTSPRPVRGSAARAPTRGFCCRDRQSQLRCRFFDRDRLPLPTYRGRKCALPRSSKSDAAGRMDARVLANLHPIGAALRARSAPVGAR